jgi:prepilin-type N-terminal cleavage/methylation domain-containing protein
MRERPNIKFKKGFTLVEMLISIAVFSLIIGFALTIFSSSIKNQRKILAQSQLTDQVSYVMEYISRAVRMAQKDLTGDCIGAGNNYQINPGIFYGIRLLDYKNICTEFFASGTQLMVRASGDSSASGLQTATAFLLISPNFTVNSFKIATTTGWSPVDNLQPTVTFFLKISGANNPTMQIQTTISQRNLDSQ